MNSLSHTRKKEHVKHVIRERRLSRQAPSARQIVNNAPPENTIEPSHMLNLWLTKYLLYVQIVQWVNIKTTPAKHRALLVQMDGKLQRWERLHAKHARPVNTTIITTANAHIVRWDDTQWTTFRTNLSGTRAKSCRRVLKIVTGILHVLKIVTQLRAHGIQKQL
jgi:hypothetical protein